ncbi:transposase, partial [Lactobacillus delbrueckii]
ITSSLIEYLLAKLLSFQGFIVLFGVGSLSIIKYFLQFPEIVRKTVRTVSMDLNCYYGDIVRQIFPNAELVIDRFHMVQMVNRSFIGFRVQVMKQLD